MLRRPTGPHGWPHLPHRSDRTVFVQAAAQFFLKIGQAFQQQRIERAAFSVPDHPDRFFVRVCLFVASLTGQRIVHIRQGYDLRCNGDLIAFQSIRIPAAIPAFMVPAGDLIRGLQERFLRKVFQFAQHICALHTVRF